MKENDISGVVIAHCLYIHKNLGAGFLESVYEEILFYELTRTGLYVERQKAIPVYWEGNKMDVGFRSDLVVEGKVMLELKSVERLAPIHFKVLLNYLKITDMKLGLLINFNEELIKNGIKRVCNNL